MVNNKKSTTATATTPAATTATTPAPAATPAPAPAVAKKETKAPVATATAVETKKAPSKKSESVKKEEPVVAATPAEATAPVTEGDEEKKGRRIVSKQSVYDDFEELITKITAEISKRCPPAPSATEAPADGTTPAAAESASKKPKRKKDAGVPIKFLRSINKRLAVLQADATKMMKYKTPSTRDNTKSGLMKPVGISENLFKFLKSAGDKYAVDANTKYARVEITRKIHQYLKDKKLRKGENLSEAEIKAIKDKNADAKPKDFRVILPDKALSSLLNYTQGKDEELTYFRLPQYLKSHFIAEETA
jgi:hypothetical protein